MATAAVLAAALPAGASAATPLPPQGIFDKCQLDSQMSTCLQRLQLMHSAGFQVVVMPAMWSSPTNVAAYAAAADALGMKVLWQIGQAGWWQGTSMTSYYSEFASACGCSTNAALLKYVVGTLASLPGTWGYYAADDSMLSAADKPSLSQYVAQIKAIDPTRPVILSSGDESQTAQYESVGDMNAVELYPITNSSMMPLTNPTNRGWWDGIGQEASDAQKLANRASKASAFILQAFSFGDNLGDGEAVGACTPTMSQQTCWNQLLYPTRADQLKLRNEVLNHAHPRIILWYSFFGTYGQAGGDTYSLYPSGAAAASQWAGLTSVINAPAPVQLTHSTRAKRHHRRHHHHRHHHRRRHRRHRGRTRAVLRHPRRLV
jgi:hypothetical protein